MYKHTWPHITKRTVRAVLRQLEKNEISIYDRSGIFEKFENRFAKLHGVKYALLTCSGTAALHSAMVACNFQQGDEVICPAYTFYATVTPIFQTGGIPVLCDAEKDGNINPSKVEELITPKTKAVMVTHMWGIPCQMGKIVAVCKKYGLKLIEDCSHAHGARYKGQLVGTFGDINAFSIQGQKILTGGEGGVLLTNEKELYYRALLFGHYNKRCKQEIDPKSPYHEYAITGFGLKLRAHPLAIAIADEQLGYLEKWHKAKADNAKYLTEALEGVPCVSVPVVRKGAEPSWYAYVLQIESERLTIPTAQFCDELIKAGALDADMPGSTCPLNYLKLFQDPSLLYPSYKGKVSYQPGDFPVAEKFFKNAIKFPIDVSTSKKYRGVLQMYARVVSEAVNKHMK